MRNKKEERILQTNNKKRESQNFEFSRLDIQKKARHHCEELFLVLCFDGFCLFGRLAHLNAGVWHKPHEKILYCQCKSDRTEYVNLSNR